MEVSVRELKNHLSEYLRRAQTGERIVITSHGKAIASLSSVSDSELSPSNEEAVRELERMPWIIPARKRGRAIGGGASTSVPDGTVDEIIDWVRGR